MSARSKNILRAISLFTVFCVLQIYVVAGPTSTAVKSNETKLLSAPQTSGMIKTTNNQPVFVNGNSVRPGTTVLSGSTIETPAGVGAILQLHSGNIEILPGTELTVQFTADKSELKVARGTAFVDPPAPGGAPQQLVARLITQNNQAITVNGSSAAGGTILTGATIETPDQVSATIDLGAGGVVEVAPNSVIKLDYDQDGNVRVKVIRGCAMTKKKSNALPGEMEVYTDAASIKTDKNRKQAGGCILPNGQLGSFSGAAAAAGGVNGALVAVLVAGGGAVAAAVILAGRGGNPSPSTP